VSTVLLNPRQQKTEEVEWARLIPGEAPAFRRSSRKSSQSVKPFVLDKEATPADEGAETSAENALQLLVPGPLQRRMGAKWLRSMASDCALVTMSWLMVGAALVPLRLLFPRVHGFAYAAGAPISLLGIALLQAALITLMGYSEGLYAEDLDLRAQAAILGKSVLWSTAVLCFAYGLQGAPWTTGGLFCITGVVDFGALWARRRWNEERTGDACGQSDLRNVLIVGAGRVGRRIALNVEKHPARGRNVCGFLDDESPIGDGVVGRVADLARMARKLFVDEVILAAPQNRDVTRWVLEESRRLRLDVEIVPDLFGCQPVEREVERVGGSPFICLHAERLPAAGLILKRLVDLCGAVMALGLLSPLLAAIAILIKLDSRGPVLYAAKRAGRKGRLFRCYKFRTMVSNADELKSRLRLENERSGPFFKMASDPRITRVGHYLRRFSLDELPQLWNVVKGEMSLVGPRPHPLDDFAGYEIEDLGRLDVTPGITGLWQVTARRDPSFRRAIELDREYIRTWSLGLDLRILLKTFRAVLCGSGE
jgi:exopolysaccharide biosynthesis polyprenyl glycosylphosphotransferase